MSNRIPTNPKIYHIIHIDNLSSIIKDGYIFSDKIMKENNKNSINVGMTAIKARRLYESVLRSCDNLRVGECVPFYFCPRSIMLFLLHKGNHEDITYREGQNNIIHLEADMLTTITWAEANNKQWAFTNTNAGSKYFEDYNNFADLDKVDWSAVRANIWSGAGIDTTIKEFKQAEFLIEDCFPWHLVTRIGVNVQSIYNKAHAIISQTGHRPQVQILREWYYS